MPKISPYPLPRKRFHGGRWRIYWKWNSRQYSLPTNHLDAKKTFGIDTDLRLVSAALTMDKPEFPEQYAQADAVVQYLADRAGNAKGAGEVPCSEKLLERYHLEMSVECGKEWTQNSRVRLDALAEKAGGILNVTPEMAKNHLADILLAGRTVATRNRALNVFNRFFKEAARVGYITANPFDGIKILKEAQQEEIVYCTREERERLIAMAREAELPDWIAVPIAFYTGMRMEEVYRMRWADIRWDVGRIVVPITKTKKSRTLEMNAKLRAYLEETPPERRIGYVVPDIEDVKSRRDRAQTLVRQLRKLAAKSKSPIPSERIGWNAWRHTFASLLAQAGVTLDIISTWMGNTPEVCKRHYAQFIPRDHRNTAIDEL